MVANDGDANVGDQILKIDMFDPVVLGVPEQLQIFHRFPADPNVSGGVNR